MLESDRDFAPVSGEKHQGCGETATGALTGDDDPTAVGAECFRLVVEPGQCCIAVLYRLGCGLSGANW